MTTAEKLNKEFEKDLNKVLKKYTESVEDSLDKLKTDEGIILTLENDNVAKYSKVFEKALEDSGYYSLSERALKANNILYTEAVKRAGDVLGRQRFKGVNKDSINRILKVDFDGLSNLGETNIIAVQNKLLQAVQVGKKKAELIKELRKEIDKFQNHAETYIRTSRRNYIQLTEDEIAGSVGFGEEKDDIWEYVGAPLQENSHKECKWVFNVHGALFTNEEKELFEGGGLFEHSEPRWNCQHNFLISANDYEDYERQ